MSIIDQIELCERQQDLCESKMEMCYDEADRADDELWIDFNMVEGGIHYKEVQTWAATIGVLSLMIEE